MAINEAIQTMEVSAVNDSMKKERYAQLISQPDAYDFLFEPETSERLSVNESQNVTAELIDVFPNRSSRHYKFFELFAHFEAVVTNCNLAERASNMAERANKIVRFELAYDPAKAVLFHELVQWANKYISNYTIYQEYHDRNSLNQPSRQEARAATRFIAESLITMPNKLGILYDIFIERYLLKHPERTQEIITNIKSQTPQSDNNSGKPSNQSGLLKKLFNREA